MIVRIGVFEFYVMADVPDTKRGTIIVRCATSIDTTIELLRLEVTKQQAATLAGAIQEIAQSTNPPKFLEGYLTTCFESGEEPKYGL